MDAESVICTEYETEAAGPLRYKKVNAAADIKNFQPPRANTAFDNVKPKQIPGNKVRTQEVNIPNIGSKLLQTKKCIQKNKILNKETNHQSLQIVPKPKLKRLPQNSLGMINKLAQKKKVFTALKTKMSLLKVEENTSAPNTSKTMKDGESNVQIVKTKVPEEMNSTQKIKAATDTLTPKNRPQESALAIQKMNLEKEISILKKKAQGNGASTTPIKVQSDSISVQDTKCPENASTSNPAPEMTEKNIPAADKKPEETPTDKEPSVSSPEKQSTDQSQTEESSKQLELDPLLSAAVEEELKDIMIQVWQELPDDPSEEEDRIVVDKLRNETTDDLRRVLGLNITKRLLNVHNNLFMKLEFTCRPQMGCLTSFLNEYKIRKFKRIDKNSNVFAAQMDTIEDFDKLHAAKEIMCGEARVRITPCYKFTQCPKNLKTIYDDTYFYEDTAREHNESSKSNKNTQKTKVKKSLNENVAKPAAKVGNIDAKSTDTPNRVVIKNTANSVHIDSKCVKNESENVDTKSTDKASKTETQKTENSVRTENCLSVSQEESKDSTAVKKEDISDSLKTITNDTKSIKTEVTVTDEKTINNGLAKDKDVSDYIIKDRLGSDDDDFQSDVPENEMEGGDELDDEDILALMSEGVVLDECSGSEDEN